jgi:hypothetical protein
MGRGCPQTLGEIVLTKKIIYGTREEGYLVIVRPSVQRYGDRERSVTEQLAPIPFIARKNPVIWTRKRK